jgi:hypothetical protein
MLLDEDVGSTVGEMVINWEAFIAMPVGSKNMTPVYQRHLMTSWSSYVERRKWNRSNGRAVTAFERPNCDLMESLHLGSLSGISYPLGHHSATYS